MANKPRFEDPPAEDQQPQQARTERRRHKWPRYVAGALSGCVLAATAIAATGGHFALAITDNITVSNDGNFVAPTTATGERISARAGAPINILLMGSDTRAGSNAKGHGDPNIISGARSDTTILLHISGDRTRALAVSIPRDSMVQLAMCKTPSGSYSGGYTTRINEAFDLGGPGCTAKTVTELTGIPIDHYMVVDFSGFKGVVAALDGVEVCLTKPVNDPNSKLNLPAGKSIVKGEEALAFVRARETLGDGSDISRIARQQEFLSSAIRKATSAGVLTNPAQLYEVLSAGAKSLTTDPGLASFDALKDIAVNASGVQPDKVVFATVPWVANADGATISWAPAQAQQLWNAMKYDQSWPPPSTVGNDGTPLYKSPATISVSVKNASGTTGTTGDAQRASELLAGEGYQVSDGGTTTKKVATTTIEYDPSSDTQTQAARTLSYATGAMLRQVKGIGADTNTITLLVGPDFGT
ncbi:MAG: LCP family protein, partial [Actinomycetes bacterium]